MFLVFCIALSSAKSSIMLLFLRGNCIELKLWPGIIVTEYEKEFNKNVCTVALILMYEDFIP